MTLSVDSYQLSEDISVFEHNYRELRVWKKAVEFADKIYKTTKLFPKDEMFSLSSQLKRAAVSVASNIAEGSTKYLDKDFARFLNISYGSVAEIDTQLEIARLQNYVNEQQFELLSKDLVEIRKMLSGLRKSILKKSDNR